MIFLSSSSGSGRLCRGGVRLLFTSTSCPVYEIVTAKQTPTSGVAITSRVKKLNFPPFVKDLFCGKFNKSMLSYAEVLNYERHRILEDKIERVSKYLTERKTSVLNTDGQICPELLVWCRTEGLHGLMGPQVRGGKDLLVTEAARLLEELGQDLSLSEFLYCSDILGYRAVLEHGSARQHEKHLESLSEGSSLATLCVHEEDAGSDLSRIRMMAKYNPDEETYHLMGTKTWVANPCNSNLFIVLASTRNKNYMGELEADLTAFLVDASDGGVSIGKKYDTTALAGLEYASVEFNCKVSKYSILGKVGEGGQMIQSVQNQNKFLAAAGIITNLKSLFNHTVEHCNSRKQFGLPLSHFDLVKSQIARMAERLYCLESMVYMTAGLCDISEYPDVELESAIVKVYAAETADMITKTCASLLGSQAMLDDSPAMQHIKQSQFLQNYHGPSNILKSFITASGMIHLAEQSGEELRNKLSPLYPHKFISWSAHQMKHQYDQAPLTHKLSDCVHPRMMTTAEKLEYVVEKIPFISSTFFLKYNLNMPEAEMVKLADIVIETYAMTCALSRSNRSYIVGNLHGEHEINLTVPYINDARLRCKQLSLELLDWEREEEPRRDDNWVRIGYNIIEEGGYNMTHPLTRIPAQQLNKDKSIGSPIMSGNNSNSLTLIKDLKPGMNGINLQIIVLEIPRPTTTKDNQEVRTVKVADRTGMVNLTVWNEPGKVIQLGDIIRMSRGYTNMFKNCLTLHTNRNGEFVKIGDFCMTFTETPNMSEPNPELQAQFDKEEAERKAEIQNRKSGGGDRNNSRGGNSGNGNSGSSNNGGGSKTWGSSSSGGGNSDPRKRKNDNR